MNKLITIVGPTAVGKTELSLQLAEILGSSVIAGDAYQVYRGMDIGTAKPSEDELERVPHYLIDTIEPLSVYSVADFKRDAEIIIERENEEGRIPILSGGTGLYVQALLENYRFSDTSPDKKIRHKLDMIYEEKGPEALLAYGKLLAEKYSLKLQFTDKHRLYRFIELLEGGDVQSVIEQQKSGLRYKGPVIGLRRDRCELYERINFRVDKMIEAGLFEEVERLLKAGVSSESQAFRAIGYKESVAYIQKRQSRDETIALIKQNTRRFAKRQITWYHRMPYISWIDIKHDTTQKVIYEQALQMIESEYEELPDRS